MILKVFNYIFSVIDLIPGDYLSTNMCFFIFTGQGLDKDILSGKIDIVFGSPESLLGEWRTELQQLTITTIVIDEFHLISTW